MIDGTYGVYHGAVHRIGFEPNGKIALFPNSDSEIDDTYADRYHLGIYSKLIERSELSEAYRLEPYADYQGYQISIARETGDEYELYLSDYALAEKLGFDRCDKYGYHLMVKKADVEVIVKKKPMKL
ncbi:MAG: hypothetical protein J5722_07455 [Oscillospiraceae bacterium]|nr:hypothetical protein [Oscillospiraceae bacterium]